MKRNVNIPSLFQLPEYCRMDALVDHMKAFALFYSYKGAVYNNEESRKAFESAVNFVHHTYPSAHLPDRPVSPFVQISD